MFLPSYIQVCESLILEYLNVHNLMKLSYMNKELNLYIKNKLKKYYEFSMKNPFNSCSKHEILLNAIYLKDIEIVKYLLFRYDYLKSNVINNDQIFLLACDTNQLDIVKFLLKYGDIIHSRINIHVLKERAFRWCCYRGNFEMTKFLLDYAESNNNRRV